MKTVVISEKWDKKAAKYTAGSLPYPYTSKVCLTLLFGFAHLFWFDRLKHLFCMTHLFLGGVRVQHQTAAWERVQRRHVIQVWIQFMHQDTLSSLDP